MGQQDINNVVQALSRGFEGAVGIKQRQAEETERQREFDLQQQASQKLYELQKQRLDAEHEMQELTKKHQEYQDVLQGMPYGIAPPGFTVNQAQPTPIMAPAMQTTPSGLSPDLSSMGQWQQPPIQTGLQQPLTRTITTPSGQTIEVPTPEALAAQEAARQTALMKPQQDWQEHILAENRAFQVAQAAQQHKEYLEIMGRQQDFQDAQRTKQEAFQQGLVNSRNATQLQIAGLRNSGKLSGAWGGHMETDDDGNPVFIPNDPSNQIETAVNEVRDGSLTLEQAKKMFNAKQWPDVSSAIINAGVKPLTDKQQNAIKDMEQVSSLMTDLYQIHKLRVDHPFALQFPASDAANQYNTLKDKVGGDLAGAAKFINGVPRFTNTELSRVQDALIPKTNLITSTGSQEFTKYEKFAKDVQDRFNTILSDIPEAQRNGIRQKLGLNSFQYLGGTIKAPGAPVGAISGANPPGVNIPGATGATGGGTNPKPGQIYVKKKSTGQTGWLSPQYYNDKIYEKAAPPGVGR